ncbi:MAG: FtsX-like permease family protein [Pegethrix bostrychoides GSE-TBD4-15B]|jgi:putative ABC transport system permease protein|uniref:FtsX-like permease family protein n=1 Tax=Pegethrix bostrychoides GSE-TBD4-15B TaxID=2839662 RepID=A0A951PE53_9CYAN|nr:FtsX-like permease family protein [Pegethrix bostrychoides GSE-TBD4-15B]
MTVAQPAPVSASPALSTVSVSNRPLWRLAWQRIRQRPLQYVLCVLGIALGVAMMVSIDLANGSAQRAFALSTDAVTGRTTHRIVAVAPTGVDESIYSEIRRKFSVPASPVVEGFVLAEVLDNQPYRLVGLDLFAESPFRSYFGEVASQGTGFVQLLTEPDTVVLSQEVTQQAGLELGDQIQLDIAGQQHPVRLVGTIAASDSTNRRALSSLMFADIATAQELLGQQGKLSQIDLISTDTQQLEAIRASLPTGLKLETAAAQKNAVQQMTAAFELNLTALSLLALVVGMFLIYNTVTFSVIQRRPIFGILRCLGVTQNQIFVLILGEAAIFSVIGSGLGVGLGIVLGRSIVGLITQTINDFYFVVTVQQVTLSNFTIVKGMVIGIASALFASALPALEAMNTPPTLILQRSTLEGRVLQLLPKLVLAWAALTGAGILLLRWPAAGLVAAFTGLFAVLLGAALLTPPLIALVLRGAAPLTSQLGILGRLAPRDILRSLSRTSVAVAALMVSVSVIVGVSVMVGSFRGTVVSWLNQTLQADIYVSPPTTTANRVIGKLDPAVVEATKTWPGIARAVTYNDAEVRVVDYDKQVKLISADGDVSQGKRPYAWIRPDLKPDPWEALNRGEGVIISEALLLRQNITETPETITLESPQGDQSFPVLAVFYDYSSDRGTIILDNDLYEPLWQDQGIASLGLFVAPGADTEAIVSQIRSQFKGRQDLSVQSNRTLREQSLIIFDRTFAITNALRLLAVIVAFIGVLSTLMSLQLERTRELGILRSTGMTPRQLAGLTLLETGLMGTMAGVFAMPLGYALAWILIYVINVRSFGWTLQMALQGKYFWQALLVAVLAALLAGIYPALRLGKMNISTAIRQE